MKTLTIGNITLDNPLILAPMAGVTDLPFRRICHEMGAGLVCMEMVSAKAICYHNKNTKDLLNIASDEHPVSLQLFGSDPDSMSEATKMIEEVPYDILDINMGCPVPKVFNNGDGSALMKNPSLVGKIVSALVKSTSRPVTVKIRTGVDAEHINAAEIAHIAEESGAFAVAVHGRTREQYYSGEADWDIIRQVKEKVSIPVIGNGDLHNASDIKRMYEVTSCDGFMIGRAARGNPWIFKEILSELKTSTPAMKPSAEEVMDMLIKHARMEVDLKGEDRAIREMRKHAGWYTSGMRNGIRFRRIVNEIHTLPEFESVCRRFLEL
ncbi:MAG: tRNA dihydrouridine synthase DusB [Lachnospiraceae bacterium]|nr:tRNA dihydrouridine synthase DusB [Lachnospiraceae bacterium]